ncbi:MAG: hypothetical protein P8Y98_07730 [Anaerolineales bacterium]
MKKIISIFSARSLRIAVICLMAFVAMYQTVSLIKGDGRLWISRISRTYQLTSMERSGIFILGSSGHEYMDFLISNVPDNAKIVVPPQSVLFSQQSILQYFLMPRGVIYCGCDEDPQFYSIHCVECLQNNSSYVPAIGEFPSPATMAGYKELIPNTTDSYLYHGVYAPISTTSLHNQTQDVHEFSLPTALLLDIIICALFFYLGFQLTSIVFQGNDKLHAIITGIPVGVGTLTWVIFMASWAGIPLTLSSIAVIYTVLIVTISIVKRLFTLRVNLQTETLSLTSSLPDAKIPRVVFLGTLSLLVFLLVLGTLISVGRGYSLYDGIVNWATKGYGIALEGSVFAGQNWGGHNLEYPQNIHIMIAIFKLVDGDILPGSKLILPLFCASLLLGCFVTLREQRVQSPYASIGMLTIFSLPIVFTHATIGWSNFIFTTYIILGVIYFTNGIAHQRSSYQILGTYLLAFAAWTRPEGVGYSLSLIIGTIGITLIVRKRISLTKWLLPAVLIPASYLIFSSAFLQVGEIGATLKRFSETVADDSFSLRPFVFLLEYTWNKLRLVEDWGYILPVLVFLGIGFLGQIRYRKLDLRTLTLFTAAATGVIFTLTLFFVAYADKANQYRDYLNVSLNRAIMPAMILLLLSLLVALAGHPTTSRDKIKTGNAEE